MNKKQIKQIEEIINKKIAKINNHCSRLILQMVNEVNKIAYNTEKAKVRE